jgi:hypothetical protein
VEVALEEQMKDDWEQLCYAVACSKDNEKGEEIRKLGKQLHKSKKWMEHLQRMPSERAPKKLLHYHTIVRGAPGWLRKRRLDV